MSADRNLLFGILAVQMNFVSRDALILAMNAWVLDKQKPLGGILADQGQLSAERLQLLDAIVNEHLKMHHNDPQQSLAALSSAESAKRLLAGVRDNDVQATLMLVGSQSTVVTTAEVLPTSTRYQILRPHARGGLGEVFVAEDSELHREVALKEIQLQHADNAHSRGRFLLEAEITGGLEHPGIVPVYGLGTYGDGRPFYAMRFIRGDSLKEAIRRFHHSDSSGSSERAVDEKTAVADPRGSDFASLEFRQLLRRFTDVCNAIAYAHSRGVLHRDLKPGNIMLGQFGETLVVDWGLAKVIGRPGDDPAGAGAPDEPTLRPPSGSGIHETVAGSALGTPAFMSPEQAAGKIGELGPTTDIYSLGATLYVLLTGRHPFGDTHPGLILSQIQLGAYQPPRQVKPGIPAPLDAVCRKAMALKPSDRYPSALALAADIDHWLADEPVSCFRDPWLFRARRWLRKHPGLTTGVAATVLVGILGLAAGLYFVNAEKNRTEQARVAAELSEEKAKTEAATATAVKEFLLNDLLKFASGSTQKEEEATGVGMDPDLKVRDLVVRAAQQIEGRFQGQPLVEAEIRLTLGWALTELGRPDLAMHQDARVRELLTAKLGPDHPRTLQVMVNLANSYDGTGRTEEALKLREETLRLMKAKLGPDHPDTLSCMHNLAISYAVAGRPQEALTLNEETLALRKAKLGPNHFATLQSMANLAEGYDAIGRPEVALKLKEETLQLTEAKLGRDHPRTLASRGNLSNSYHAAGRIQEALKINEETFQLSKAKLGPDHPETLRYMNNLVTSYWGAGRMTDALALLKEILARREQRVAAGNLMEQSWLAWTHGQVGEVEQTRKFYPAAVQAYAKSVELFAKLEQSGALKQAFFRNRLEVYRQQLALCRKAEQVVKDLNFVLEQPATEVAGLLDLRVQALAAQQDLGGLVATAEAYTKLVEKDTKPIYNAGCAWSLASGLAKARADANPLVEEYAGKSLALLKKTPTGENQFFSTSPALAAHMKKDTDLDPLRGRDDFEKLVSELETRPETKGN